ncbi:carbon-nitrogen family hydrolase [Bacillus sp. PS06]|uniref:carbon-nitrogen family hydrolase n=1 Tax=Bacillus sp. PS06 TaxID=2764176 RepID=UPI0017836439|nr:carbon-nitrogen family hydrolase [Bacillus sp. PS06]MBD8067432.1 carbon-nitrogen family hydrolase [Bacillus sp. PS06]
MNVKVALIQLDIAFGQPFKNIKSVEDKIVNLMIQEEKPDVIVLPELWTTGYDLTRLDELADIDGKETIELMSHLAKKYDVNIIAGSIAKGSEQGVTNTMFVFDRSGSLSGEYSKLHLFQLMDEHHYLQPGQEKGLFEIDGVPSAGLICYDIRFPEWIRAHTTRGAEVIFVVAEWPLPRLNHWKALLISRAIENQCYVVACNRAGQDPNNTFAGHSLIIDPWGEILAEADREESILEGTLELEKVKYVRKQIPIFQDRRPTFYE